jgi:regulator of sigma E protease
VSASDPSRSGVTIVPAQTSVLVTAVDPGKPAESAGVKPGDVLLRLDTIAIRYDAKVREIVRSFAGKPMAIEWRRGDSTMRGSVTPTAEGRIGIGFRARYDGPTTRIEYSVFGGIGQGFTNSYSYCRLIVESLWLAIVGKTSVSDSVGGPLTIAQVATQYASYGLLA